jgi:hypothetical protein
MTKCDLITQSHTKRVTASALANAKARNSWSNGDAGDALGIGEGTIRNRLDGDDPKHQMTVHELLRSINTDTGIANEILAIVKYRVSPTDCDNAPDAIAVAGSAARCAADIITAAPGGFDEGEAKALLPGVSALATTLIALEAQLRAVISASGTGSR